MRARIIMQAGAESNVAIARAVALDKHQVSMCRRRYPTAGLDGLREWACPGRPLVYGHRSRTAMTMEFGIEMAQDRARTEDLDADAHELEERARELKDDATDLDWRARKMEEEVLALEEEATKLTTDLKVEADEFKQETRQ